MTDGRRVRLTPADAELFMRASHDRNPLHWDDGRFAANPFGRPVVHGALSVFGLLGAARPRGGGRLARIACRFLGPVFPGEEYAGACLEDTPERVVAQLRDGQRVLVEAEMAYGTGPTSSHPAPARTDRATAPRREPATWTWPELATGHTVRTVVSPLPGELGELVERFELAERGVDRDRVAALAWCSYLVGMELPGSTALFSGFETTFAVRRDPEPAAMRGEARVVRLIPGSRAVHLAGAVAVGHTSAQIDLSAYVGP